MPEVIVVVSLKEAAAWSQNRPRVLGNQIKFMAQMPQLIGMAYLSGNLEKG